VPTFVPGVELARSFYTEVVRPLLDELFPRLRYSAALLGAGSEVLGYDTERSTDHEWGPRLLLFLDTGDVERSGRAIVDALGTGLPTTFRGYSTHFEPVGGDGPRRRAEVGAGPVAHRIEVHEAGAWFRGAIGFDPAVGVGVLEWLGTPTQLLLHVTAGEVFCDDAGVLEHRRRALAWYPRDVWLHLIGCQWLRVAQEEAFVGRAGEVGDDLGSRVIAGRVARDLMRLCFLLERRYAPYSKWLGRAFETLACAGDIRPHLTRALTATRWQRREAELGAAAERAGMVHNSLGLMPTIDTTLRHYYDRPFLVLDARRFAEASFAAVTDPEVARLPRVGAIDQWVDSTDVLVDPRRARAAMAVLLAR
jgi:hypothetical protein